ncbi:SpoIIE family protein phosphatase [Streptacidiphilus sp. P02-A3a]|uniref:ATP-binding SpoIIE family protein phosphatase n=1 Tax=Streptacidiphilus sp. P02-A3a TaxID=2704468 RepID=UPI0015FC98D1|nr:SpoIIE family protein phosphatase [Streptacidiphilus sp. P02-A3a]QMU66865.1 SpoIIE family protein phosphatase [Streptacidiphilus sp. P02-A3a]
MPEETFAAPARPAPGAHGTDAPPPGTTAELTALVRLAALMVDPDGRLTLWNRAAEELFGHRRDEVFDRTASGLLPLARHHGDSPLPGAQAAADQPGATGRLGDALDQLDDLTSYAPSWSGDLAVTDRDGRTVSALCWAYRLIEPTGRSLLVLAADGRRLRAAGPRLGLGERVLRYAGAAAAPEPDLELDVSAVLMPAPDPDGAADRLVPLLPRTSTDRRRSLLGQVVAAGAPGLRVDGTLLPLRPYQPKEGATASGPAPTVPGPGGAEPRQRPNGSGPQLPAVPTPRSAPAARPRRSTAEDGPFTGPPSTPTLTLSSSALPTLDLPATEPVNEQLRLLSHVGAQIGTTLDLDATVRELCDVVVPNIADFACVDLRDRLITDAELPRDLPDDETRLRRVAVAFSEPLAGYQHRVRVGSLLALPRSTPSGFALQTNQPVLVPRVDREVARGCAAGRGGSDLVPLFEGRSMLTLPLAARGTVLGILTLLRTDDRPPFDQTDASYLRELAARVALSVDNARLHRVEAKTALTLQRSMLPSRPPKIPGVLIAHRYLPGDRRAEVGGDWFDAIQLPGSRVALVVGDVMGHGLHSAVAMGRFRTAMQTLAALDLPPGQILRHLDNLSQRLGDDHLATCLYAVYDPIARTCVIAGAGHVPPVLVHPDGRGELLEIPSGAPIGVGGVPFASREIKVSDGSMLVLCTDGLVEMRGGDIGDGLAALCGDIVDPRRSPDEVCDTVLERLHTDDRNDDLALLIARFDGIPPQDVMSWSLELDPEEVGRARRLVREQLAQWGLDELAETTALLVSELVTNALRVAGNRVQLQLMRVDKLLVEVSDDDHNLPSLEPSEALDEDGRGLSLVSQLSARWGTSRKAVGKVVWFELPLPHRG